MENKTYKIWYWRYDPETQKTEIGFRTKEYKRKGNAKRAARKIFSITNFCWTVSDTNPFIKKCSLCGKEYHVDSPHGATSSFRLKVCSPRDTHLSDIYWGDICRKCAIKIRDMLQMEAKHD